MLHVKCTNFISIVKSTFSIHCAVKSHVHHVNKYGIYMKSVYLTW